jgi:hypothetical protein
MPQDTIRRVDASFFLRPQGGGEEEGREAGWGRRRALIRPALSGSDAALGPATVYPGRLPSPLLAPHPRPLGGWTLLNRRRLLG